MVSTTDNSWITPGGRAASIDWDFIRKVEGDIREPYIPIQKIDKKAKLATSDKADRRHYKVIDNSGVTIGAGVDLGQQNLEDLKKKIPDATIRASIEQKLGGFFGKRIRKAGAIDALDHAEQDALDHIRASQPELASSIGMGASDFVQSRASIGTVTDFSRDRETPHVVMRLGVFGRAAFALSAAEIAAVEAAVKAVYTDRLAGAFDRLAKANGVVFGNLPSAAQTAAMSLHYHTGSLPGHARYSKFWSELATGQMDLAVTAFEKWVVQKSDKKYVDRRKQELRLLQGAAALNKLLQWTPTRRPGRTLDA